MMRRSPAIFAVSLLFSACSGASPESGFVSGPGTNGSKGKHADAGGAGNGGGQSDPGTFGDVKDGGAADDACQPNPANFDFPGNHCDDDGDGIVDNPNYACDDALAVDGDANAFVKALGLCQPAANGAWGVVSASFTNTHGGSSAPNPGQHGILGKFGSAVTPRAGKALGVLSSGWAREFDEQAGGSTPFKGGQEMSGQAPAGALPAGFPRAAAGCPQGQGAFDLIDAKIQVKVPANAKGLQFDFDFWSGEWPEYVCTEFNDAFIAFLTPSNGAGANVSFDKDNNPVSVNNGFFDRCTAGAQTGCEGGSVKVASCPGGTGELAGTGFLNVGTYCNQQSSAGGGATGWLTSQAPVTAGDTITLELVIWDTGDSAYDSSVLLDNFQWIEGPTTTGTVRPPPK